MKKIIFYLLALCTFSSVKSANKDISYKLTSYAQSITTTVQEEYKLTVPEDIVRLLLEFAPSRKYQTSNVYLANITQTDMVQEKIKVYLRIDKMTPRAWFAKILRYSEGNIESLKSFDVEDIDLIYDKKLARYYFEAYQPQKNDRRYHIRKKSDHECLYVALNYPPLQPSAWYKAELEEKNAQNPTKKITLYKSKVCIYNHTGQLSIDINDYDKHIDEETIYIHPECTTQEIKDTIALHLHNQREDKPYPLLVMDVSQREVPAKRPCYFTLVPSDVARSAFHDSGYCLPFAMNNQRATIIMDSRDKSLYDIDKSLHDVDESIHDVDENKKSELAPSCCERMQKHKNTIGMSLLPITVAGLAYYYANFFQGF